MILRENIRIRDPFVLVDEEQKCYYLYGSTALAENGINPPQFFSVYRSNDLEHFEEPVVVLDCNTEGVWAKDFYWAPEVHKYNGKYYLFGTMKAEGKCRGTLIFVADRPEGPFRNCSEVPVTPADWECLDGTLWVENGKPYMVFCHEWLQVGNGEICAVELSEDLSRPVGEAFMLFRATDEKCVTHLLNHPNGYVTDGPFLYREEGKLKMIWSSFSEGRYLVLEAESESGTVAGPWIQKGSRFDFDGGHAMLFHRLDGQRMISLHAPNRSPNERPFFYEY